MFLHLYSLVASDLSGTGILGIVFAGILGMLLIWDARGNRQSLPQRTSDQRTVNQRNR
jgi:hypothetical protein